MLEHFCLEVLKLWPGLELPGCSWKLNIPGPSLRYGDSLGPELAKESPFQKGNDSLLTHHTESDATGSWPPHALENSQWLPTAVRVSADFLDWWPSVISPSSLISLPSCQGLPSNLLNCLPFLPPRGCFLVSSCGVGCGHLLSWPLFSHPFITDSWSTWKIFCMAHRAVLFCIHLWLLIVSFHKTKLHEPHVFFPCIPLASSAVSGT